MNHLQFVKTKDNSFTLFNPELNETYHSIHGAITESKHVFIKNGLKCFFENKNIASVHVLEIGFGTGLNALLSYLFCIEQQKSLHYISYEPFSLSTDIVKQINYTQQLNANKDVEDFFLGLHVNKGNIFRSSNFAIDIKVIESHYQQSVISEKADVIFFDAFAPNKHAEMWLPEVFSKCYNELNDLGILVTYCAKGEVKRTLKSVGFKVETLAGPPGKREMIRAVKL
jgi:tRNA U34 5-methylaminomethyl-2-thiouridine-forming methyltransferase MnmC